MGESLTTNTLLFRMLAEMEVGHVFVFDELMEEYEKRLEQLGEKLTERAREKGRAIITELRKASYFGRKKRHVFEKIKPFPEKLGYAGIVSEKLKISPKKRLFNSVRYYNPADEEFTEEEKEEEALIVSSVNAILPDSDYITKVPVTLFITLIPFTYVQGMLIRYIYEEHTMEHLKEALKLATYAKKMNLCDSSIRPGQLDALETFVRKEELPNPDLFWEITYCNWSGVISGILDEMKIYVNQTK